MARPERPHLRSSPAGLHEGQTFIGDYIGAVATAEQLVVSAIEPVVDGGHNRAVVLRLPLPAE